MRLQNDTKEQQRIQQEMERDLAEHLNENKRYRESLCNFLKQYPAATAKSLVKRGYEETLIRAGRSTRVIRSYFGLPHPPCTKISRFIKKISNEEIKSGIIGIIAKRLSITDPISLDDMLIMDYGANTLDLIEIQMDIEDKYSIQIPWDEIGESMDNIGEIVHYVEQKVQKRQNPNIIKSSYPEQARQIS